MLTRRIIVAAFGFVFAAPFTVLAQSAIDAPARHRMGINARQERQAARIHAGRVDKELTRGELERLRADEAAIRAEERVYRRTGDGLNRRERRDLQRDLNRTSREIYRARHNNR